MAVLTADFELGTDGSDVLTGDAGSATAWDFRVVPGGTLKYSTTQAAHGTKSMKADNTSSGSNKYMAWRTALGTVTDHYGRFYVFVTAYPTANTFLVSTQDYGVAYKASIYLLTDGKLRSVNSANATLDTTTNSVPLNTWVRIEYHIIHSTTVGMVEVKLFNTMDSTTPTETITSAANKNTGANANGILLGVAIATTGSWILYMDDIVANAASYPGPYVAPSTFLSQAVLIG